MWVSSDFSELHTHIVNILENASPIDDFVTLDIDATVLFPGRPPRPNPHGMFVRDAALDNDIATFYITAREESPRVREFTHDNLASVGIFDPPVVILKPPRVRTWPGISKYKTTARMFLENRTGGRCVMNVGDQWTDLLTVTDASWQVLENKYQDKHVLFSQSADGETRWSLKLAEDR